MYVIERGFEEQPLKEWFLPMKRLSRGKEQMKEIKRRRNNRNEYWEATSWERQWESENLGHLNKKQIEFSKWYKDL